MAQQQQEMEGYDDEEYEDDFANEYGEEIEDEGMDDMD